MGDSVNALLAPRTEARAGTPLTRLTPPLRELRSLRATLVSLVPLLRALRSFRSRTNIYILLVGAVRPKSVPERK